MRWIGAAHWVAAAPENAKNESKSEHFELVFSTVGGESESFLENEISWGEQIKVKVEI